MKAEAEGWSVGTLQFALNNAKKRRRTRCKLLEVFIKMEISNY